MSKLKHSKRDLYKSPDLEFKVNPHIAPLEYFSLLGEWGNSNCGKIKILFLIYME